MGKLIVLITVLGLSIPSQARSPAASAAEQPGGDPPTRVEDSAPSGGCRGGGREQRASYQGSPGTFTASTDRDGTVHFDDRISLDVTDAIMRLHGDDPYRLEKARLLTETRDQRAAMARDDRSARLRESVMRMRAYLEKVWTGTPWPAAQRRIALFALWQEVAEDGDPDLVATGAMVRATILGFIRDRLPSGGADAYTPREIDALNAQRTCRARFEPYAAASAAR